MGPPQEALQPSAPPAEVAVDSGRFQVLQVTIPESVSPGDTLAVQAPSGEMLPVTVPSPQVPGTAFEVEFIPGSARLHVGKSLGEALRIRVPEGASAGHTLEVTSPSGKKLLLEVPSWASSGMM